MMRPTFLALCAIIGVPCLAGRAADLPAGFVEEMLAERLDAATAIAAAQDGRIFIAEQTGRLRVWKEGRILSANALDLSERIDNYWERGLIGVTLHPDFPRTPHLFGSKGTDDDKHLGRKESEAFIQKLIQREGIPCQVKREHLFEHQPAEKYDAIVNLGVTEHLPDYKATLEKYQSLLKPGGKIYLDASSTRKRAGHATFLEKYIYPGNGSLMCLHEYLAEVARSPFRLRGVWDDQHSYYLTLKGWAEGLDRAADPSGYSSER